MLKANEPSRNIHVHNIIPLSEIREDLFLPYIRTTDTNENKIYNAKLKKKKKHEEMNDSLCNNIRLCVDRVFL